MDQASLILENAKDPHVVLALILLATWFAGVLIHHIGRTVLLRVTAHMPIVNHTLRYIARSAGYAIPLLLIQVVLRAAPDDLRGVPAMQHISAVLFIVAMTWVLINVVRGIGDPDKRTDFCSTDHSRARACRKCRRPIKRKPPWATP